MKATRSLRFDRWRAAVRLVFGRGEMLVIRDDLGHTRAFLGVERIAPNGHKAAR
jgi:hypothetical protein